MEILEQPKDVQEDVSIEKEDLSYDKSAEDDKSAQLENEKKDIDESTSNMGSNLLGKFKDVDELTKAYNSLQAEFTRKCQKLKLLEKKQEQESSEAQNKTTYDTKDSNVPIYLQEDYREKVTEFITNNPYAKQYAKDISKEIMQDSSLTLQGAYNKVLAKKYREPKELLQDKNFIEDYILNDENLKKELVKKYVEEVKESKVPYLISGNTGISAGTKDIEISNLEEANKLALKLFRG